MSQPIQAALFDLDGVIVDTAKYHYLAWKQLADELGLPFDEHTNERLKGVSRMASLEIILESSDKHYSQAEKEAMAERKNANYVEMIKKLQPDEVLPGMPKFLKDLRGAGIKTSICSASKNAVMILENLQLIGEFDTIVSGNDTTRSKPDPQVFQIASDRLGIGPDHCVVFEDAFAGVQAAKAAGMRAVGIGSAEVLHNADVVYSETGQVTLDGVKSKLNA